MRIASLTLVAALAFANAAFAQATGRGSDGERAPTPPDAALAADNARAQQDAQAASTSPGTSSADDHGHRGGNTINDTPERKVTPRAERNKDVKSAKPKKAPAKGAPEAG